MRVLVFWIAVTLSVTSGTPVPPRIVGGSLTTIEQYPYAASMLFSWLGITYSQACGGTIINNRVVLSAAHCFEGDFISSWRIRVGSSYANSGGVVHSVSNIIIHPNFNRQNLDSDIALLHTHIPFTVTNQVSFASIASEAYNVPDSQIVWAIGWGVTSLGGPSSEQLRHVQIWTVNQNTCRSRYNEWNMEITDNMLCSGWLDVGGRDQCQGDSGGPLLHNNVVVGICSWGYECARARFPGVNVRVSRFTSWILANA